LLDTQESTTAISAIPDLDGGGFNVAHIITADQQYQQRVVIANQVEQVGKTLKSPSITRSLSISAIK